MVGKTVLVTSGKGGVGCSTVAARLAVAFARRQIPTLLVDLSAGNPALDLLCGLDDRVVYDARDVLHARIDPRRAALPVVSVQNLTLLPGATIFDGVPGEAEVIRLFETLRGGFDQAVMILDVPKEIVGTLSEFADLTLAVSDLSAASLRATASLNRSPRAQMRLVLNRCSAERDATGVRPTVREALDYVGLPLAAILLDEPLVVADGATEPGRFRFRPAFDVPIKNLSIRITGGHAPLLSGLIRGRKRRKILADMAKRRLENA
ncbi:MAG: P-loop NTPase [Clostridia bacterium]|nr:P-loop NTPase [Clostridia bacterium]